MDLSSLQEVTLPRSRGDIPAWRPGMAALGGGTWLFSEPQPSISALVDLTALNWPALTVDTDGLHIAATCTIAALSRFVAPPDWRAADLIGPCCEALLGSFKIWNVATVGGNICLGLPAGPMTALAASLGGIATIWCPGGIERKLPVADLVVGDHETDIAPGEILREVLLPLPALRHQASFRRISLTALGRSGALLIGTAAPGGACALTITAATVRPVRLTFLAPPTAAELTGCIEAKVTNAGLWHDDVHGAPDWRRHVSLLFAEEIRREIMER